MHYLSSKSLVIATGLCALWLVVGCGGRQTTTRETTSTTYVPQTTTETTTTTTPGSAVPGYEANEPSTAGNTTVYQKKTIRTNP